jgi:hypothetical protein
MRKFVYRRNQLPFCKEVIPVNTGIVLCCMYLVRILGYCEKEAGVIQTFFTSDFRLGISKFIGPHIEMSYILIYRVMY